MQHVTKALLEVFLNFKGKKDAAMVIGIASRERREIAM
jgi:hypothetical protein